MYILTATGPKGCIDTDTVNVLPVDLAVNILLLDTFFTPGGYITDKLLIASDPRQFGSDYLWSTGSTALWIYVQRPASTTTYSLTVTNGPCSESGSITYTVYGNAANAGPNHQTCSGETVVLGDSSMVANASYLWSTGDTTALVSVAPQATTTYTLWVTIDTIVSTDQVVVEVTPQPNIDIYGLKPAFSITDHRQIYILMITRAALACTRATASVAGLSIRH